WGLPGFDRNVPEPLSVIFEPSFARADAWPPAEIVPVAKLTLMMSQRIDAFFPCVALFPGGGFFAERPATATPAMTKPSVSARSKIHLERFISPLLPSGRNRLSRCSPTSSE